MLRFEQDVAVPMNDGLLLRANVFRPGGEGRFPVVLAHGPYGKDVHFRDGYKAQFEHLLELYPDLCRNGSSGRFLRWETADPERWVPDGYVLIHVDSRGAGKSPGYLDPRSARETADLCECIEWAARQPWSNGKVGMLGISYYAINQWQVAALQPPHLAAIIPWEGASDAYRDSRYHGGILSNNFPRRWWPRQVLAVQHGNGDCPHRDPETGGLPTGAPLSAALLAGNRVSPGESAALHRLDDAWFKQQTAKLERIQVPLLSAGNWGGMGLHLRGNVEGFLRAGSRDKWLEMHGGTHYESFYLPEGVALQKRFFDRYLKGIANGWESEPRVQLAIRRPGGIERRMEQEWPLARTRWSKFYLDARDRTIRARNPPAEARLSYAALGDGLTFTTPPFTEEVEITGPLMARLWAASSTSDLDLFLTLRAFDPSGAEVVFSGASEPAVPITQGWLRASHRKLDPLLSTPYRPYHSHDEVQKLEPDALYALDVEIWPTSMVYPPGYRLALTIQGQDFERPGATGIFKGSGPFLHNDPQDRDPAEFAGTHTLATGGAHEAYLLLPVIPT